MHRLFLAFAAACLLGSPAMARMSGFYESAEIIHAILGDNQVADGLRQQPIESIARTRDGYVVQSQNCSVGVVVETRRADRPGRDNFSLRVQRGRCRR
ncbi:hypothetical protein CDV50_01815 [Haematobacter massiliensis]|uniref:Uncharacterized protein n=1 Tax=Haematobacter massiliensis TaxID=195105 RepID=A0A086YB92_9RHOB|nr:hypothetical protein [Haematobacter massiliensis]KFI31542.1 hypothetical protein CN97_09780 [Haematobacter massiliensis]OWJ73618.1 hypothetical protein CDV50_01815 [Haematobacter massiliensis]OWJ87042.1 hypothetical protein CDV51_08595 [Haematobacter massiliensis]QBJ23377.1 hypothetical protein HmaOT1_03325 [Haematobacter massiliensis]